MTSATRRIAELTAFSIYILAVLITGLVFYTSTVQAQEIGFVALSQGLANYDHLGEEQKATSSFFLVNVFEDYNIAIGAMILNSHQQVTESRVDKEEVGTDLYEIQLDNIRHTAWGTLIAYSISTDSFLGFQGWAGLGYLSNTLESEGTTVSLYNDSDSSVTFCDLKLDGKSGEVKSIPMFIGVGITVWGFGIFAQYMEQQTEPLEINVSVSDKCSTVIGNETFSDQIKDSFKEELKSSFTLISTGIQYRF